MANAKKVRETDSTVAIGIRKIATAMTLTLLHSLVMLFQLSQQYWRS